jgi:hypothetical protein
MPRGKIGWNPSDFLQGRTASKTHEGEPLEIEAFKAPRNPLTGFAGKALRRGILLLSGAQGRFELPFRIPFSR